MERGVFTLPEVEELLNEYVVASVVTDIQDPKADAVWAEYGPENGGGVPHYVVLNSNGEVQRRIGATLPPDKRGHEFVAFLKGVSPEEVAEDTTESIVEPVEPDAAWPDGLLGPPNDRVKDGFDFEAKFSTDKIKPGGEVSVELHFKLKQNDDGEPYHLYHPDTPGQFSVPLEIIQKEQGGFEPIGEWEFPTEYTEHYDDVLKETYYYLEGEVVVVRKFRVPDDIRLGTYRMYGLVKGQYCDSGGCVDFQRNDPEMDDRMFGWVAAVEVSEQGAATAVTDASSTGSKGKGNGELSKDRSLEGQISEQGGLLLFLLFAFGAGMVTLLTPCVLPVLPLTVGFFVSQHDKGKSSLLTAFIYCTCIVASFTFFGILTSLVLGATGAQNIATNGYVNSFLGILFLVFALSFLGLFELKVPNFMTQWFTKKQMNAQKEGHGYAKAFFSGSAFALISFSCTGPIAGAFLAGAATGSVWMPALAMLAFSSGMALPIFIIGQFPSLMKKMPKSGGWMNAMKVVFGFIELGLAIMYISAAEQAFASAAAAEWVNRYVVLAVWIAVSLAAGVYLFGFFRMPHDHEETQQIGVIRAIIAVLFISFALYLIPGMFGARFGATLEGILPIPPKDGGIQLSLGNGAKGNDVHDLDWYDDLDEGLEVAKTAGKPVFIDFTGFN